MKQKNLIIRLDSGLFERLNAVQRSSNLTKSAIIRLAIDAVIGHYEKGGRLDRPIIVSAPNY